MNKFEKIVQKVLSRRSGRNIKFRDLCNLPEMLGFDNRIRGSHPKSLGRSIPEPKGKLMYE